jgi:hypothetical protein
VKVQADAANVRDEAIPEGNGRELTMDVRDIV